MSTTKPCSLANLDLLLVLLPVGRIGPVESLSQERRIPFAVIGAGPIAGAEDLQNRELLLAPVAHVGLPVLHAVFIGVDQAVSPIQRNGVPSAWAKYAGDCRHVQVAVLVERDWSQSNA